MDKVIEWWKSQGILVKIVTAILIPLAIMLLVFSKGSRLLLDLSVNSGRKKTDEVEGVLGSKEEELKNQSAAIQGSTSQLEKDKDKAIEDQKTTDSVDFHNSRR